MSGFDRLRGGWTHRRLGLGRTRPSEKALAHADGLLTEVGGRIPSDLARDLAPDPVRVALLDFVTDIDLSVAANLVAEPFDVSAYRRSLVVEMARDERPSPAGPRRAPIRERFLVPAMSAATAAVVLVAVFVAGRGSNTTSVGNPATAASAESQVLLQHASLLLTAASTATEANRIVLVREARSDLQHVSKLLPLIGAPARPAVRMQLRSLERETKPSPAPSPTTRQPGSATSGSGTTTTKGSTKGGTTTGGQSTGHGTHSANPPADSTPVHHGPNPNQPPAGSKHPTGSNPTGSNPTGFNPTGSDPSGQNPTGQIPTGQNPTGQNPTGHYPPEQGGTGGGTDPYGPSGFGFGSGPTGDGLAGR